MEEKAKRHKTLREILHKGAFSTQGSVVAAMRRAGFDLTQSSISRDFHDLGVLKVHNKYTLPEVILEDKKKSALQRMVLGMDKAGQNLVVVKTTSGAANAVAQVLDEMPIPGVVGTVAGDNTFFVAVRNKTAQSAVIEAIRMIR